MALLDSTFLIDLMRGRDRAVNLLEQLDKNGEPLVVSTVTLMELQRGVAALGLAPEEQRRIVDVVQSRVVQPLDAPAALRAGEIDAALWARGEPIDPEEAMIAGTALTLDQELVARSGRGYGRVPGLRLRTY
ncbi:MAG TPA: PIN domain-containing protein [Candidatus Thermoplasmatota archaeon]|nr:PIN domain-containing protein [Candidatus Thermoplasmatota archaeon]